MFTFEEICELATPIARKHGIKSLSLFGSYARGDATETSDVDFLVQPSEGMGLFQLSGLLLDLQGKFGEVDLVTTGARDKDFLARIAKDCRVIYER
ncbi:MAG: nucleotidyltransferase domain-containing protein [Thermoguttaceae bacterium]|nr:nucleotidyltransferase domain-containing protein [Thermoguttaceae bacterium]MBQ7029191.1 nucleotidyltransferase domain-containing protein [Thermoguttaceae bacterium]